MKAEEYQDMKVKEHECYIEYWPSWWIEDYNDHDENPNEG